MIVSKIGRVPIWNVQTFGTDRQDNNNMSAPEEGRHKHDWFSNSWQLHVCFNPNIFNYVIKAVNLQFLPIKINMTLDYLLSWLRAHKSLLFLLNAACSARSNTYQFHSFWFDPMGFEPTIYHTAGEYANHYTTNVVWWP